MGFEFLNSTPIYLQIVEHIKTQIISKKYLPNQKIPSVRELSLAFEVNPNTVQKALSDLEDIGLIYTERTNGKFVTDKEEIINKVKEEAINKITDDFYESMKKMGFNKDDVLKLLNGKE